MFKFGFSEGNTDVSEAEKHTFETSEKSEKWLKSEEIFIGNNIVAPGLLEDANNCVLRIELEDKYLIRHVSTEIVVDIIRKKKDLGDSIFQADQEHSDLITAVYEGGLKIWQCTYDLLNYVFQENINFMGKKVLDLGCGAGILGLYAYIQGASVYFQDYNPEVLRYITIPNALLNNREGGDKPNDCRFYSGDWKSFIEVTQNDFDTDDKLFDFILTSETIYNCKNYYKLNDVFNKLLKKTGTVYLAAKTYYFGVGGGLRSFEGMIKADNIFNIENCWQNSDGVQRQIIALKFKK